MSTPTVTIAQLLDAIFKDDVNQMQACIKANPTLRQNTIFL